MPLWKSATTTGATLKECHYENPPYIFVKYNCQEVITEPAISDALNTFKTQKFVCVLKSKTQ